MRQRERANTTYREGLHWVDQHLVLKHKKPDIKIDEDLLENLGSKRLNNRPSTVETAVTACRQAIPSLIIDNRLTPAIFTRGDMKFAR
jgi:hypothetical protein